MTSILFAGSCMNKHSFTVRHHVPMTAS